MTWNRKRYGIIAHFQQKCREICDFMLVIFLGATLETKWKFIYMHTLYPFLLWFKGGAQENYSYNETDFCRFLLKMGNYAIPFPVSSHIVTLELFPTQNLIWISIAWYLLNIWARLCGLISLGGPILYKSACSLNSKFYFHPLTGSNHANLVLVLYMEGFWHRTWTRFKFLKIHHFQG
jgi:hypothetical protein